MTATSKQREATRSLPAFALILAGLCMYYFILLSTAPSLLTHLDTDSPNDETKQPVSKQIEPIEIAQRVPFFSDPEIVSQMYTYRQDKFRYEVCELQLVCIASNETVMYTTTPEAADRLNEKYKGCIKSIDAFCICMKRSGVRFESVMYPQTFETKPTWLMYQWLPRHHVAHYAFSLIQFHSILLHSIYYSLPSFERILFQDNPSPLNPYETTLLEIAQDAHTLPNLASVEFLSTQSHEYEARHGNTTRCFESVYTSRLSEVYATSPLDLDVFRGNAEKRLQLPGITSDTCPPLKALVLVRKHTKKGRQRKMKNMEQVISLLNGKGVSQVDVLDLNGSQSLLQQAQIISQYGLIISSHSSQLANMLFARRNAVVMEVSVVYKPAFRVLGQMARLKYINSVGHAPDKGSREYVHKLYAKIQKTCTTGDMWKEGCGLTTAEKEALKSVDYVADLGIFERDLDEGLQFLRIACNGTNAGWDAQNKRI
ncbi:hypothetical protein HDU98_004847 [Podochytrium sp. JEL0797]|nr:hypothetical protein HDU98_004847 [Podochytrium sp. JEL0797]